MNCLKCNKCVYCSKFCKPHFQYYFERKFKSFLSKNKLLAKNEVLNLMGENKEVVEYLLKDLGRKVDAKFNSKGSKIESFSLDTKAVRNLALFMQGRKQSESVSFLECFTQEEINNYAKLVKLRVSKPKFTKFETKLAKLLHESLTRRPNIYYCTYNMLSEFGKL